MRTHSSHDYTKKHKYTARSVGKMENYVVLKQMAFIVTTLLQMARCFGFLQYFINVRASHDCECQEAVEGFHSAGQDA